MQFEWTDLTALVIAISAFVGLFLVKRSSNESRSTSQVVDADVLGKFAELFERIGNLEAELRSTQADLFQARLEIKEMVKLEEYLNGKVHDRDKQVASLQHELTLARQRIAHLEEVCRRAGINGDDEPWNGIDRRED